MGGISVYIYPQISLPYKFLCGYWLFSLFEPGPIRYRANVRLSSCFFYLLTHHNLYPPKQLPNEIPGYAAVELALECATYSVPVMRRFGGGVFEDEKEEHGASDVGFVTTSSLDVGPSTVIEFQLVTACHRSSTSPPHVDEPVRLEYSVDHGMSWSLVLDGCWPPSHCTHHHPPSVYHIDELPRWKRVTIVLPPSTWCVYSQFTPPDAGMLF